MLSKEFGGALREIVAVRPDDVVETEFEWAGPEDNRAVGRVRERRVCLRVECVWLRPRVRPGPVRVIVCE